MGRMSGGRTFVLWGRCPGGQMSVHLMPCSCIQHTPREALSRGCADHLAVGVAYIYSFHDIEHRSVTQHKAKKGWIILIRCRFVMDLLRTCCTLFAVSYFQYFQMWRIFCKCSRSTTHRTTGVRAKTSKIWHLPLQSLSAFWWIALSYLGLS